MPELDNLDNFVRDLKINKQEDKENDQQKQKDNDMPQADNTDLKDNAQNYEFEIMEAEAVPNS